MEKYSKILPTLRADFDATVFWAQDPILGAKHFCDPNFLHFYASASSHIALTF